MREHIHRQDCSLIYFLLFICFVFVALLTHVHSSLCFVAMTTRRSRRGTEGDHTPFHHSVNDAFASPPYHGACSSPPASVTAADDDTNTRFAGLIKRRAHQESGHHAPRIRPVRKSKRVPKTGSCTDKIAGSTSACNKEWLVGGQASCRTKVRPSARLMVSVASSL